MQTNYKTALKAIGCTVHTSEKKCEIWNLNGGVEKFYAVRDSLGFNTCLHNSETFAIFLDAPTKQPNNAVTMLRDLTDNWWQEIRRTNGQERMTILFCHAQLQVITSKIEAIQ